MPALEKTPNIGFIRTEVEECLEVWDMVNHCSAGAKKVKEMGELYLPKPDSDNDQGKNDAKYKKFLKRAVFYPVTGRTLHGLNGQVFSKPVDLQLPPALAFLEEDVDGAGISLTQQAKEALSKTLKHGGCGLLTDAPATLADDVVTREDVRLNKYRPKIVVYNRSQIINWRVNTKGGTTQLEMLMLYELAIAADDGYEFKYAPRWREFRLEDGGLVVRLWKKKEGSEGSGQVEFEQVGDDMFPTDVTQNRLQLIPFSFIGATNNDEEVDEAPLAGLASLNIHHYMNSADYEWSTFIAGQPTPVFTGLTDAWVKGHIQGKVRLGSANAVSLPEGATASLLQASPNTMPMEAMVHKEGQMLAIGAKLIESGKVQMTATEKIVDDVSAASVLSTSAKNVGAGYEKAIGFCALFVDGADVGEVLVELNSEFEIAALNAAERAEVVLGWQAGALTFSEMRKVYKQKGIATLSDEEAIAELESQGFSTGELI
tara:strand:- start:21985 stop:23442 length:1458 start_codon:yes stop_codon:yes gene_type:complete